MSKKELITMSKKELIKELYMQKKEIIQKLYILVSLFNRHNVPLGIRCETSEDPIVRSKDIRAFLSDLFLDGLEDDEELKDLFYLLDEAIRANINIS